MRGKGQKQRIIPFSVEMRRRLYRFVLNDTHEHSEYIFTTTTGTVVSQRNALRDLKAIAKRAELPNIGFHALRHLYATNYIRSGGNVMMLRRMLGHSSLTQVLVYEHLQVDDLREVHHKHSLVAHHR